MQAIESRQYQVKGTLFCRTKKRAYLAVDMGLGKTKIVIDTFKKHPFSVLIFAPLKGVYNTWPQELEKWDPAATFTILHGLEKDLRLKKEVKYYIINPEGIMWLFKSLAKIYRETGKVPFRELVIDEGTMWKSSGTKRFKALKKLLPMFDNYRLVLSGTPMPNSLVDLWSQYFILDEGDSLHDRITVFKTRYFNYAIESNKLFPKKGAEAAIIERIRPKTFRLDAKDYLELPELVYETIELEFSSKLRSQYRELERTFLLSLSDETTILVRNMAALSVKLRQFLQGGMYYETSSGVRDTVFIHTLKLEALKEQIEVLDGEPLMIAIQFKFELELLQKFFGNVPFISGGVSAKVADKYIREWNKRELPILAVHPQSMSHSINMQYGGNYITWLAQTWSLEHFDQLNGRLHRSGQTKPVICKSIVIKDTLDTVIHKVLQLKGKNQNSLLNALNEYKEQIGM